MGEKLPSKIKNQSKPKEFVLIVVFLQPHVVGVKLVLLLITRLPFFFGKPRFSRVK